PMCHRPPGVCSALVVPKPFHLSGRRIRQLAFSNKKSNLIQLPPISASCDVSCQTYRTAGTLSPLPVSLGRSQQHDKHDNVNHISWVTHPHNGMLFLKALICLADCVCAAPYNFNSSSLF